MSYPTTGGSYVINEKGEFVKRQDNAPDVRPQQAEQTPADQPEQQPGTKEAKK